MEDDIEEGTVHVQLAVVANEARFVELIHEETHAGLCGADHVGQLVLTDLRNGHLRLAFLPQIDSNRSHAPAESPWQ